VARDLEGMDSEGEYTMCDGLRDNMATLTVYFQVLGVNKILYILFYT